MVRLILLLLILMAGPGNNARFGDVLKPVAAPEITITAQFASDMAGDLDLSTINLSDLDISDLNLSAWDAKVLKKWQDAVNKTRLGGMGKGLYQEF
jgi:hypothetical protein